MSDFLSVLNSAVLVRQELAPSINIYTHVQHILVVMVVHWNCTAQSYVVSYKSFTSTSTVKFWVCVLPGQKLFSTPPIPCCAVPSIREWQAQSLDVKHQTDNCTVKMHRLKCLFLPLTGWDSYSKCLTVLWKGSQKEMNVINKTFFFFHQKQPPNCPPVSTPQRRQPVAYKLLRLCEMKHSSICQNKRENGRIIVMIYQQVLTPLSLI